MAEDKSEFEKWLESQLETQPETRDVKKRNLVVGLPTSIRSVPVTWVYYGQVVQDDRGQWVQLYIPVFPPDIKVPFMAASNIYAQPINTQQFYQLDQEDWGLFRLQPEDVDYASRQQSVSMALQKQFPGGLTPEMQKVIDLGVMSGLSLNDITSELTKLSETQSKTQDAGVKERVSIAELPFSIRGVEVIKWVPYGQWFQDDNGQWVQLYIPVFPPDIKVPFMAASNIYAKSLDTQQFYQLDRKDWGLFGLQPENVDKASQQQSFSMALQKQFPGGLTPEMQNYIDLAIERGETDFGGISAMLNKLQQDPQYAEVLRAKGKLSPLSKEKIAIREAKDTQFAAASAQLFDTGGKFESEKEELSQQQKNLEPLAKRYADLLKNPDFDERTGIAGQGMTQEQGILQAAYYSLNSIFNRQQQITKYEQLQQSVTTGKQLTDEASAIAAIRLAFKTGALKEGTPDATRARQQLSDYAIRLGKYRESLGLPSYVSADQDVMTLPTAQINAANIELGKIEAPWVADNNAEKEANIVRQQKQKEWEDLVRRSSARTQRITKI